VGKLSGAVYHGGDDLSKVIVEAYARYSVSNPIHPDVSPTVRKMKAESGGTDNIIMSIKTYRDWARKVKGITEPEMFVRNLLTVFSGLSHPRLMQRSTKAPLIWASRSTKLRLTSLRDR